MLVNTSLEIATDTILEPVKSADSLQHKIRMATEEKRLQRRRTIRRTSTRYQRMNTQLTARMDSLIKGYEEEMSARARQDGNFSKRCGCVRLISLPELPLVPYSYPPFPDLNYAGYYS